MKNNVHLSQTHTSAEVFMLLPCESLSENVCNLVAGQNVLNPNLTLLNLISDEMMTHSDVLCTIVEG